MGIVSIIIFSLLGAVCGFAVAYYVVSNVVLKKKKAEILTKAELEGEGIKKEKIFQAKEKFLQLKSEHEKYINEKSNQILQTENKVKQKELILNQQNALHLSLIIFIKFVIHRAFASTISLLFRESFAVIKFCVVFICADIPEVQHVQSCDLTYLVSKHFYICPTEYKNIKSKIINKVFNLVVSKLSVINDLITTYKINRAVDDAV